MQRTAGGIVQAVVVNCLRIARNVRPGERPGHNWPVKNSRISQQLDIGA